MFQTAFGRILSDIITPSRSLDLKIFIDAGGKAGHSRVWGGLAVIGNNEMNWLEETLNELGENNKKSISPDGELKGRNIPTVEIQATGNKIINEDRRILFWANFLPEWDSESAQKLTLHLEKILKDLRPNPHNINQIKVENNQNTNTDYFSNILVPINKYKVLSIIIHIQWIISEIKKTNIGQQLKSVTIEIDRENFPNEKICSKLIKDFFASGLQSSGMDITLTGKAYKENADEGAVKVNTSGDSKKSIGINFVDILLQDVLRKSLPIS